MQILDGKKAAQAIRDRLKLDTAQLAVEGKKLPHLVAILVGNNGASETYVAAKVKACEEVGFKSTLIRFEEATSEMKLLEQIRDLNIDPDVDGILVQLPLPKHISDESVINAIDPEKDVDGFHPINIGRLSAGQPTLVPCTPAGILKLLNVSDIPIAGVNAVVVGRSQIVGRPMAQLLLHSDATVTICHSRTHDLASVTRQADLLVVAIGRAGLIGREHIKPGATVVDVGMNKVTDEVTARRLFGSDAEHRLEVIAKRGFTLVGDVNPAEADEIAGRRTPVPGGVGLLTVAMLMSNTLKAAIARNMMKSGGRPPS